MSHLSNEQLAHAKVILEGVPFAGDIDISSRAGQHRLTPENVCWLRTFSGSDIACVRQGDGVLKKLSLAMCQAIWPGVQTKSLGGNRRIVASGVTIPIIPPSFYKYKIDNQRKSRAARRPTTSFVPLYTDEQRFQQSCFYPPERFFRPLGVVDDDLPGEAELPVVSILRGALQHVDRTTLLRHSSLCRIHSPAELASCPFSRVFLQVASLFVPAVSPDPSRAPPETGYADGGPGPQSAPAGGS
jgi:hypothetical protein